MNQLLPSIQQLLQTLRSSHIDGSRYLIIFFSGLRKFLLAGSQLRSGSSKLLLSGCNPLLSPGNLFLSCQQLVIGILQFLLCLCLFRFIFGQAILILLLALPVGLHCFLFKLLITITAQFLCHRLQFFRDCFHRLVVFIAVNLVIAMDGDVDLRIDIHIHAVTGQEKTVGQRTAAHGSRTTVHIHIQR